MSMFSTMDRHREYHNVTNWDVNRRLGGGPSSGQMGLDLYDNLEEFHNAWLNTIDDFVSPDEPGVIHSPFCSLGTPMAITGMSDDNPCLVTCVAHGFSTGDTVYIVGVTGLEIIKSAVFYSPRQGSDTDRPFWHPNGKFYTITKKSNDTFELDFIDTSLATGDTGTTYTTGGWVAKVTVTTVDNDYSSSDVTAITNQVTAFETLVDAIDPYTDTKQYSDAVDLAVTESSNLITSSDIEDAIDRYETSVRRNYIPKMRRFSGDMAMAGAAITSGYAIGMALIEQEIRREVADFRSKLYLQTEQNRYDSRKFGVDHMIALDKYRIEQTKNLAVLTSDVYRMKIQLSMDVAAANRAISLKNALWPISRYQYAFNGMAAIMGATASTDADQGLNGLNVLGNSLSIGAAGAQLGFSLGGSIGAGVGFVAGATYGLFSSIEL